MSDGQLTANGNLLLAAIMSVPAVVVTCAALTVVVALLIDRESLGMGWFASFSAFIAAREVTAYPALKRLWP